MTLLLIFNFLEILQVWRIEEDVIQRWICQNLSLIKRY